MGGDLEGVKEAVEKDQEKLKAIEEEDGAKPLHCAVRHNREDMVKKLMELGADVEVLDKDEETPLLYACKDGHANMVRLLVEQFGANMAVTGLDGQTGLHRVADRGREGALDVLISLGAEINARDAKGRTPLHVASASAKGRSQLSCVRKLVEAGADTSLPDDNGQTALCVAAREGHEECIRHLLKNNADPNICDKGGRSPLYWTSFHAHIECARILKEGGAKDLESERGQTALAVATMKGHEEIIKML